MKHQIVKDLVTYWENLREGAPQPERRDLDLAKLRPWLAWLVMFDADTIGGFRVSMVGAGVCSLFGRQLRGTSFTALWRLPDRPAVIDVCDTALNGAEPMSSAVYATPADRAPVTLELLVLPLAQDGRLGAKALCALKPALVPDWIGLIPLGPLTWTVQTSVPLGRVSPSNSRMERTPLSYI
ncbi:MAG: hypothetical protein JWL62_3217 [Hyphomicrobiales bacterium]|nr:hypothetical protein [Hyphomicrobiales bacterium]